MTDLPSTETIERGNQFLVTFVPDMGLLQFANLIAEPELTTVELSRKQAAARLAGLSAMYLTVGAGEHSLRYISKQSKMAGLKVASEAIRLSNVLPDDIAYYGLSGDGREVVRFGQIDLSSREPTSDESLLHSSRVSNPSRPTAESNRQETLALDPYKIDLTGFDNVSIRIGERMFHLNLDSPLTFLTARVIGKLSHLSNNDLRYQIDADAVAKSIWDSMPLAERSIHVKEGQLFGLGAGLGKKVDNVFNTLTSMLGVTRRRIGARQYAATTNDISLRFGQVPQESPLPNNVSLLLPPGTNPDIVLGEVPDRFMEMARGVLPFVQHDRISQPQALEVLYVILERDGKRALNALLGGSEKELSAAIGRLDELARRSLLRGYYTARISRTPLSKQVDGKPLSGAPRSGGSAVTPRWHIVEPSR